MLAFPKQFIVETRDNVVPINFTKTKFSQKVWTEENLRDIHFFFFESFSTRKKLTAAFESSYVGRTVRSTC
jgi:hypothetical protein